jgi:hypothetical protein
LAIFGPGGLKGTPKHCINEHFFSFVNQNRAKPWVIVTLHTHSSTARKEEADYYLLEKKKLTTARKEEQKSVV